MPQRDKRGDGGRREGRGKSGGGGDKGHTWSRNERKAAMVGYAASEERPYEEGAWKMEGT